MDDYNDSKSPSDRPKQSDRLRTSPELFSDYIALIYSSIWSYALNIPFPKVPNYPSPIKFAEHYASWQYSILTEGDEHLSALRIDLDNAKPRICTAIPRAARDDQEESGGGSRGGRSGRREIKAERARSGDVAMNE